LHRVAVRAFESMKRPNRLSRPLAEEERTVVCAVSSVDLGDGWQAHPGGMQCLPNAGDETSGVGNRVGDMQVGKSRNRQIRH
jgi:hypothetical protein